MLLNSSGCTTVWLPGLSIPQEAAHLSHYSPNWHTTTGLYLDLSTWGIPCVLLVSKDAPLRTLIGFDLIIALSCRLTYISRQFRFATLLTDSVRDFSNGNNCMLRPCQLNVLLLFHSDQVLLTQNNVFILTTSTVLNIVRPCLSHSWTFLVSDSLVQQMKPAQICVPKVENYSPHNLRLMEPPKWREYSKLRRAYVNRTKWAPVSIVPSNLPCFMSTFMLALHCRIANKAAGPIGQW